ncbi:MAG: NADH-quinone oxidoreductase subunit G, partial [Alphaproteobacteria bacterium]|nr:NADH-quinone oxidoreductase subunit G [Alphaproteobacteria bacterium]
TRCIRFITEVAGVPELGATGRGERMEVGTYVEKALSSELSGNIVDLCPVGALTSKPYAFAARPWELTKTDSVDVLDAVGSNIRVDARGPEVLRVLPRLHEDVNEEWISDKTRHACDGLRRQRLDRPYVRRDGKLQPASWAEAFDAIKARVSGIAPARIAALTGDLVDAESVLALKDLMGALGVTNLDCRQDGAKLEGPSGAWLFNTTIAGIERADACLIVGANPRTEATLINARLRKRYLAGNFTIGVVGPKLDMTYPVQNLGAGPETLAQIAAGQHPFLATLQAAKNPMIIVGMGALARADGAAVLAAARQIADAAKMVRDDWNGFNVLHTAAGRVGALTLGFLPGAGGKDTAGILDGAGRGEIDVVYLLGADELDTQKLGKAFVIYQGHHGDRGAHRADVILPGAAYTEKHGTYVNTEGRVQRGFPATFPRGDAREDWKILRALAQHLGKTLPYDTLVQLRARLGEVAPRFAKLDVAQPGEWGAFGTAGALGSAPFASPVANFYMTDPISRASETMAACTDLYVHGREPVDKQERTGTYG